MRLHQPDRHGIHEGRLDVLRRAPSSHSRGTSMIEVLVTLVILAIGLLGVAGLQSRMSVSEVESYQREQALLALTDMVDRIYVNPTQAANYVTATPLGTGDSQPASCAGVAVGPALDQCQWSQLLKGASEQTAGTTNVGGMQAARGCVAQVQAANTTLGICAPGIYQVTVVWQGTNPTAAPSEVCGQGSYGNDATRRALASTVTIPTKSCY